MSIIHAKIKREGILMRETILDILNEIAAGIDFESCTTLIDDGFLSSLDILQLIGALNDEFDLAIPAAEIVPENFNSVDAIEALVRKLQDD